LKKSSVAKENKENFQPIEQQELNKKTNGQHSKDKVLKNIDIRTGKVIKTSSSAHQKRTKKAPLFKWSLLANEKFKHIPNVAKKSGPVKK